MTAFVYGYNVNGYTTFQATKAIANKQTNVYDLKESMPYYNEEQHLSRRLSNDGIFDMVEYGLLTYKVLKIDIVNSSMGGRYGPTNEKDPPPQLFKPMRD